MKATIFDTETTGLIENHTLKIEKQPEVIEFYAALWDLKKAKKEKELHLFIRPSKWPLPEEIKAITRIKDADLEDKPSFKSVAPSIREFISGSPLVIAHNASFDVEMIDIEFERLSSPLNWPRVLCTVEQTIHFKGYRLSMMALHEYLFGEKFEEAHRANKDSEALARVCCELFKRGEL